MTETFVVPACHGRAFHIRAGQVLTIVQVEGKQMADVAFLNAHDHREVYDAGWSVALNMLAGEGDMRRLAKLYSKPPRENVMLTVVDDPTGVHLAWNGGRCTSKVYERFFGMPGHRSCQENLTEALEPFGLTGDDVPDVFNAFMNVDLAALAEGRFNTLEPVTEPGDSISLRAEMDLLVAVSACPFDVLYEPKPLGIRIADG